MNILKLLPVFLLSACVVSSPLRAQDDSNKSLGEKTSEGAEKAKDSTVNETHKVANTTRHVTHKVANTTRHVTHKVANTTRHKTHKAANTVRHETGKKSEGSSDANQKSDSAASPR